MRTKEELEKAFRIEIKDFENCFYRACKLNVFDEMREKEISNLATILRKLLIDSSKMSSLVSQMHIREDILFPPICTFSSSDYAGNLVSIYPLIYSKYENGKFFCRAFFHKSKSNLRINLDTWLHEIVIDPKGEQKYKPTRQDIIRMIADKEGGAHYDENHDETYSEIVGNYAFEIVHPDDSVTSLSNNVYFETLLSISYEFIQAISEYHYRQQLTKKTIFPSKTYLVETSYRLNKEKLLYTYNKYIHYETNNNIHFMFYAFDPNGKADYRLIPTKAIVYYSLMENKFVSYLIPDFNSASQLVFVGERLGNSITFHFLIRNNKSFSFLNNGNDLSRVNGLNKYTLPQAIRFLKKQGCLIEKSFLENQYVFDNKELMI